MRKKSLSAQDSGHSKTTFSPMMPSEYKFGLFFSAVFLIVSIYTWKNMYFIAALVFAGLALTMAILAFFNPKLLRVPNKLWFNLGLLIGKIMNPIILRGIFFGLITPSALLSRLFGRDELRIKKRQISSYWITRKSIDLSPESFKNQY